jgi:ApaG protein
MLSFSETTENITVIVKPIFLETESDVIARKFIFAYFIRIENNGNENVQLLFRHWIITHGTGKVEEVEGDGVIGKQPVIAPKKYHEYNSFCVLETFDGFMEGTYTMQRPNGEQFNIVIPRFTLKAMAN